MNGLRHVFQGDQSLAVDLWTSRLRMNGGLHSFLLSRATQLPLTKRKRGRCNQQCRSCYQPKPQSVQGLLHRLIILRMTYLVALAFLAILGSLATALFFMMKDGTNGKAKTSNMARALAFRIGFSVLLFVCILIAWKLGYIQPTGLPVGK